MGKKDVGGDWTVVQSLIAGFIEMRGKLDL